MEPKADTPRPEYNSQKPFLRCTMTETASKNPNASPELLYFCCTVLIVSNGANSVLEHAAAIPEARLFFRPSITAEEVPPPPPPPPRGVMGRIVVRGEEEAIVLFRLFLCLFVIGRRGVSLLGSADTVGNIAAERDSNISKVTHVSMLVLHRDRIVVVADFIVLLWLLTLVVVFVDVVGLCFVDGKHNLFKLLCLALVFLQERDGFVYRVVVH
mmetsp:Transcript_37165/g.54429  ORF Transcript_37165/g.54429 Transcript_37165/m.54429 type:complete len:213 (-) Transcript_37165:60-698(-)